jgi:hypothetical protein
MRKQYHSRMSAGHRLIWDVDTLVRLALELPVEDLPLSNIRELAEPYWFERDGPAPTCRAVVEHAKLINAADLQYPIIICPDGRVMDGMHRVARAALEELPTIRARRFVEMPTPDYVDVPLDSLPYDEER